MGNEYPYEYLTRLVWGLTVIHAKLEIVIHLNLVILSLPNFTSSSFLITVKVPLKIEIRVSSLPPSLSHPVHI